MSNEKVTSEQDNYSFLEYNDRFEFDLTLSTIWSCEFIMESILFCNGATTVGFVLAGGTAD